MKKAAFLSLGCKVNSYETNGLIRLFEADGYIIVPFSDTADVYVVNTCTVTNMADHKSRQMLHRAKKKNPEAVIAAVGCYVEAYAEEIDKDISVDVYTGNQEKSQILSMVNELLGKKLLKDKDVKPEDDGTEKKNGAETEAENENGETENLKIQNEKRKNMSLQDKEAELKERYKSGRSDFEELPIDRAGERTRAVIKIQDGCNQFCSYCVIPYARGKVRSRRFEDILDEVNRLVGNGYKEIVLTGIHLSSYGIDQPEQNRKTLMDVLEAVDVIPGLERVRLGSLEPRLITEENVKRMTGLKKLCPHFHLSLQSGCKTVLERMNRHYTPDEYYEGVLRLRDAFRSPAITTDVIVGFPQETEDEWKETLDFVRKVSFSSMHIFKYSKREGTIACEMKHQVPEQEKTYRAGILSGVEEELRTAYENQWIGKEEKVLFEEKVSVGEDVYWIGHTARYVRIGVKDEGQSLENRECKVSVMGRNQEFLYGVLK